MTTANEQFNQQGKKQIVTVSQNQLPLCCPMPNQSVKSLHPRVFLALKKEGQTVSCPYCGTSYRLTND